MVQPALLPFTVIDSLADSAVGSPSGEALCCTQGFYYMKYEGHTLLLL